MVWLPDDIWKAQKAAKAAEGGTKKTSPVTKKTTKSAGGQDMQSLVKKMMSDPNKQKVIKTLMGVVGGASSLPGAPSGSQAKMFISQFIREKTGATPTKDTIAYTTTQVEGSKPPQFISEVTLLSIDPTKSYKGKPASSKKLAEVSAAEAALRQNGKGAMLKGGGATKPAAPKKASAPKNDLTKIEADKKVWVGNLPKAKDSLKELKELCKAVGNVKKVESLGKGTTGCVVYNTAAEATMAIAQLSGSMIGGNVIEVDVWTQK